MLTPIRPVYCLTADALAETLDAIEPDILFTIAQIPACYATVTLHDDDGPDIECPDDASEPTIVSTTQHNAEDWEFITGLSNQYNYTGACFHSSEYIGSSLAAHLRDMAHDAPQTFMIAFLLDDDHGDTWCILHKRN